MIIKLSKPYIKPLKAVTGQPRLLVTFLYRTPNRHIDTAYHYQNEDAVGRAINHCINEGLVTRADIFVATKLADHHKLPGMPEKAIRAQLDALGLEYIDLYLIHSPWSTQPVENCWQVEDRSKWCQTDGDKQGLVI